jgi:uncharacterized membrane protein YhaH (DUF805 family)
MAGVRTRESFRFLYRQDQGRIGRRVWWIAALPIMMTLGVMTLVWLAIMPRGARDLSSGVFFDRSTALVYAYLLVFTLALLIGGVMFAFLGAKRLRDAGRPPWLAPAPLLALFLAGAAHWAAPRSGGAIGPNALWIVDVLALSCLAWAFLDMGFRKSRG